MTPVTWENRPDGTVAVSSNGKDYIVPSLSPSRAQLANSVRDQWGNALDSALDAVGPDVPKPLALAIILSESGGNAGAVSHSGAIGLMQVLPSTAGKTADELKNVQVNLRAGVQYLQSLEGPGNDVPAIASMYNAGFNPANHRPWPNAQTAPAFQTAYGFRAEPGYIDNVIAANNYYITGQANDGSAVTTSQGPIAKATQKPSLLPVLAIAGVLGVVVFGKHGA